MNENLLKFEVIWKDEDIIELQISANNGRYSGVTEVYEVSDSLLEFVNELKGFPFGKDRLTHSCGEKYSYAYFEMDFYKISQSGICGVLITMEENVSTEYRKEEKDKLSMELTVEPNAIDIFCKELKTLAEREEGIAELKGIVKYSNNII
ncbi:hypothetical protein AHMF7605_27070 [Adhaeribacter arboris]|uniref:Uncharacterized protein n=1 Tax=Adhaeribacter arboris TaxID=2072846 RepID=A0A2T2YN14_9BACT|nr:hypothetical protein [Adhaeribacter arboris]PSR56897.1 hypothetical protein AHMF7605_27070 [Adhaeribacter arboris]